MTRETQEWVSKAEDDFTVVRALMPKRLAASGMRFVSIVSRLPLLRELPQRQLLRRAPAEVEGEFRKLGLRAGGQGRRSGMRDETAGEVFAQRCVRCLPGPCFRR